MKIEQHWDDVDLYVVVYTSHLDESEVQSTMIILPPESEDKLIREKIHATFSEIKEIRQLEYFSEALYLKN